MGAALFGINFLFYTRALQTLNISTAYPVVVGMSTIMIIALSYFFLNERLAVVQVCGIGLVIAGLALIHVKM